MLDRRHFGSTLELLALYDSVKNTKNHQVTDYHDNDIEGERILREGTDVYNSKIEEYSRLVWESVPVLRREWSVSFAGAFPSVPAYLAGEPENMWRISSQESNYAPLRIYFGTGTSWGLSETQITRKYAALTAFAQALVEVRPVILTPYQVHGGHRSHYDNTTDLIFSWDLQTSPMILSEIAANVIEPRVIRGVLFSMSNILQPEWNGQWGYKYQDLGYMREVLQADEEDLVLGSTTTEDPLVYDPVTWIRENLVKYTQERE